MCYINTYLSETFEIFKMELVHSKSTMDELSLNENNKKVCYLCYVKFDKLTLIDTFFTPIEYRGNGYAKKLLQHFLSKEAQPIFLVVRIGAFVGGFYQRMGFKRIATFGHYDLMAYSDKSDEELLKIWMSQTEAN